MYEGIVIPQEVQDLLPAPTGYRLLIATVEVNKQTKGGVYIPDELKDREKTASIIGCVVRMGPDAYKDSDKFDAGPYCKEGDFVLFRSYSGTKFRVSGTEFRIINDDTVEAVVPDPRHFERV
uniref:Co-chaperonin GroES n=1 Tax=uncultured virus TaxID=340016 RepID=A0A221S326_9VIRU|nr:co-chaperonin GroES [uncultured virus]